MSTQAKRNIPLSLPWTKRGSPEALETAEAIRDLVLAGRLSAGPIVNETETQFADAIGVKESVMVSNGTDALILALKAVGVEAGDKVIVPGFTFIATANAALAIGAEVIAVDIDPVNFCMDPERLTLAAMMGAKAVMPVHLYGHPAPMREINEIAKTYGLMVVEDAAQAHGAATQDGSVGGLGDVAAFSFYATKNIGAAGEGGAVTTNNEDIAEYVRLHKGQGMGLQRYDYRILGGNERMSEISARSIQPQIAKLDEDLTARNNNAHLLNTLLADSELMLPSTEPGSRHAWHQYTVLVPRDLAVTRDELSSRLSEAGVGNGVYYPQPLDEIQPLVADKRFRADDLTVSRTVASEVLSLPVGPWLKEDDVHYIANAVLRAVGRS